MNLQQAADKLLIVDDEAKVRSLLLSHFEKAGLECVAAESAQEALEKMSSQCFSLVISDVVMPGMSGLEFLRRAKEESPTTQFIMVTGLMDINAAIDSLRIGAFDFIAKPFEWATIRHAADRALDRRRLLLENLFYREELERKVRERTFELNEALHDVEESYQITLEALVAALDAREHETQAHSQRVREYTLTLAENLGSKHDELIQTGRGALLHDVGKIAVRDSILLKPGKLTESEWVEMRMHPQIGYNILQSIEFLAPAAEIVLCHQERWDGRGYPNGLAGEDIPLGARIFAVADTLDAMTSDRPYRKALSFDTAIAEIRSCSGTQFDPRVVDAFLAMPQKLWRAIHDSVNGLHQGQNCFDAICPKSNISR
jgi:response regulator RpfG family c-di-GMP phosphodiesterase